MTGHYLILSGYASPEGCRVVIRNSDYLTYRGSGFTIQDAFDDAIRSEQEALEKAREEERRSA